MIKIAAEGVVYKSLEAESNNSLREVKVVILFSQLEEGNVNIREHMSLLLFM